MNRKNNNDKRPLLAIPSIAMEQLMDDVLSETMQRYGKCMVTIIIIATIDSAGGIVTMMRMITMVIIYMRDETVSEKREWTIGARYATAKKVNKKDYVAISK